MMMNGEIQHDSIIILDYGSQYSQLIARRLREAGIFCRLTSWRTAADEVVAWKPKGFVLSGGPNSVFDEEAPTLPAYVAESGKPVLGICYGLQLLAHSGGGKVARGLNHEYGRAHLELDESDNPLFIGWQSPIQPDQPSGDRSDPGQVWMSHADLVTHLPIGYLPIARTDNSPYAAICNPTKNYYAVQFHPEVAHTTQGALILRNFAQSICRCEPDWTPRNFISEQVQEIRRRVGDGKVIVGLSGGVDSAVTAVLVQEAIGDQLTGIFIDNGLLRRGEAEKVVKTFESELGIKVVAIRAVEEFMDALSGIVDPERKRKIIGELFIRLFEREASRLGEIGFLGQGTIYPDVIESAAKDKPEAHTIKTHHNVGGLPDQYNFELIEPLRLLFKDEVRQIGIALGIPEEIVWRQPFPGPGLAVRCLGSITWDRLETLKAADAIFLEELARRKMLLHETQQAFAVLLPVQSVGVMGDGRSYDEVVALRAVTTEDFMTADWARLPEELLAHVSNRIINEVTGVNRVVYDITSKPPATIEWE